MWRELQPGDPQVIGPYRLRGQLGVGGMGRVNLGVSAGGRPVAVKVVRADLATDPEFRARFQREVAVARKVSGPFTAPLIDADTDGPEPWLETSYVAGPSLADAVSEQGPLPAASVLELAAGLAEGLCAIHAASVVHRDLKPSNVLLAEDGPRVIDFGISLAAETSPLTRLGMVVGSPGFMSPEQAEGRDVGPSSDIFSLGAVLAFAATGEGPFGTGSAPTLAYRVVYSPPSLDSVPADVRPLIESCLDKDPGRRPAAKDLLAGMGTFQPATGWLPEPMTRTFAQQPPAPTALDTAPEYGRTAEAPVAAGPINPRTVTVARLTPPWGQAPVPPPRRERRRRGRPLAIAALVTGLLAASAAGGVALAASAHPSAGPHSGQAAPPPAATAPVTSAPPTSAPASTPAATASTSSPAAQPPGMSPSAMPSATMSAPASSPSPAPSGSQAPAPSQTPAPASSGSPAPSSSPTAASGSGSGSGY
jgi:eukaryotic-like serine/threonine-protein kinase